MGVVLACAQVRADPAENAQPCRAGCIQHGVGCVVEKKKHWRSPLGGHLDLKSTAGGETIKAVRMGGYTVHVQCHVHGVASWWFSGAPEDLHGPSCTRKMCAVRLFPCEWLQIEWDTWAVRMACPGCSSLATNRTLLTAKGGWPPSSHWEQGYCLGLGWVKVASIAATSDGKHKLHAAWRWECMASSILTYLPEHSFFVVSNQLI